MLEHFTYRHLPPILLASTISIGGMMPYTRGPEPSLLLFGFPPNIASNKGAWPVIKVGSARVTTIGVALLGMYAGAHLEAMDILFASMGWMALIDGLVCWQQGAPGSFAFRVSTTGAVALWGLLGMTSGKYL